MTSNNSINKLNEIYESIKKPSDVSIEEVEWAMRRIKNIIIFNFGEESAYSLEVDKIFKSVKNHLLGYCNYHVSSIKGLIDFLIDEIEFNPNQKASDISKNLSTPINTIDKLKVFIVHGHDDLATEETARYLEKLGLKPVILREQPSKGNTIIEKIEENSDVGFGVVLYTECDLGTVKTDPENLKNRARQNVVFEHGFLIGKIGRNNVRALVKGNVETPNDISGVVYIKMEPGWKMELFKELKSSGFDIDANDVF